MLKNKNESNTQKYKMRAKEEQYKMRALKKRAT